MIEKTNQFLNKPLIGNKIDSMLTIQRLIINSR